MRIAKTLLIPATLVGFVASPALAALEASATTDLNLRAGPGPQYEVQDIIPSEADVFLAGCIEGGEWCEVTYEGASGWAYSAYLTTPVESQPVVIYQNAPDLDVQTLTYEEKDGQGLAAGLGAGWGAAAGSLLVGGPAAVAAGALIGAATGAASQVEEKTVTYVQENPVEPIYLNGEVAVGAGVPEDITVYEVPDSDYAYLNVNKQPVIIDPETRRIVTVVR